MVICAVSPGGMLFPQDSETRQVTSLDGLWNFVVAPVNDPLVGFRDFWFKKDLQKVNFYSYDSILRITHVTKKLPSLCPLSF